MRGLRWADVLCQRAHARVRSRGPTASAPSAPLRLRTKPPVGVKTLPPPNACPNFDNTWSDCGHAGISEAECLSRGCCWDPTSSRAWCYHLGRLERPTSSTPGFAVGSKISLADVMLFRHFGDVVNNKELGYKAEPFGSSAKTDALLASFPKIKAIVENVRADAKLQSYLAARPQVA